MSDAFFYQALIEERASEPLYYGSLPEADITVTKEDLLANDKLTLSVKLDSTHQRIISAKWQGKGCAISRAVMETIVQMIMQYQDINRLKKLTLLDILKPLGLERITPSRFKCADLGWQIFQAVLAKTEKFQ